MFNRVLREETIPEKSLFGHITPIYKGKGQRDDMQNHRGITVNSNIEKVFERILNSRIQKVLPYIEAQVGGRAGRSTTDQLFTLKAVMQHAKKASKPLYIAFLDIQKAYDKAWLDAILYTLWTSGIRGRLWRILRLLNTDVTARIKTKYGLTRIIMMTDNIRQGGVLLVMGYAKMVDDMCETLTNSNRGTRYGHMSIPALLLMDDITLLADSPMEIQQMDTIHHQAMKYHVRFGANKCKVMPVNDDDRVLSWKLGPVQLETCTSYRYLGEVISRDCSLKEHLASKTKEVNAALANLKAVMNDAVLSMMPLAAFVDACILPSLTYAAESWCLIQAEAATSQKIQNDIMRRALSVPTSTPVCALHIDLGIYPIAEAIDRKMLSYWWRIQRNEASIPYRVMETQKTYYGYISTWSSNIQALCTKYSISDNSRNCSKG